MSPHRPYLPPPSSSSSNADSNTNNTAVSIYASRRNRRSNSYSPPRSRTHYYRRDSNRNEYGYDRFNHSSGNKDDHDRYYKRLNEDKRDSRSKAGQYYSERGRGYDYQRERKYSISSASPQIRRYYHEGNENEGGDGKRERDQNGSTQSNQSDSVVMSATASNSDHTINRSSVTMMNSSQPVPSHDYSMFVASSPPRPKEEGDDGHENSIQQPRNYMGYCDDHSWSGGNKKEWKEEVMRR